jgi:hypothetical protein
VIFEKEVEELGCLVITGGGIGMLQGCFINMHAAFPSP